MQPSRRPDFLLAKIDGQHQTLDDYISEEILHGRALFRSDISRANT